jgi:hypothetical protein
MLALALTATLLVAPTALDEPPLPTPEQVEATVAELEQAFKKGEPSERVAAIEKAAVVLDRKVVVLVAKGLKDKDRAVVEAALEGLRVMDHPESVAQLHRGLKTVKALKKDDKHLAALLRAIGQHGSPDSLKVLLDDPLANNNHKVVEARILAIARIRTPDAVAGLMNLMQKVGRQKVQPYMQHFSLALQVLTGADEGRSRDAWIAWWNDNKRTLEVSPELPDLPRRTLNTWQRYWDELPEKVDDADEEREKRRRRKGKG